MESLDLLSCDKRVRSITTSSNALVTTSESASNRRAMVQASLSTVFGRKGRHLSGTFCLTGDTMEGIIQCLVFLKAFSVSLPSSHARKASLSSVNVFLLIFAKWRASSSGESLLIVKRAILIRWTCKKAKNTVDTMRISSSEQNVMIKWNFYPHKSGNSHVFANLYVHEHDCSQHKSRDVEWNRIAPIVWRRIKIHHITSHLIAQCIYGISSHKKEAKTCEIFSFTNKEDSIRRRNLLFSSEIF